MLANWYMCLRLFNIYLVVTVLHQHIYTVQLYNCIYMYDCGPRGYRHFVTLVVLCDCVVTRPVSFSEFV